MPYNQSGPNSQANFGTYNDVGGDQIINQYSSSVREFKGIVQPRIEVESTLIQILYYFSLCFLGTHHHGYLLLFIPYNLLQS